MKSHATNWQSVCVALRAALEGREGHAKYCGVATCVSSSYGMQTIEVYWRDFLRNESGILAEVSASKILPLATAVFEEITAWRATL